MVEFAHDIDIVDYRVDPRALKRQLAENMTEMGRTVITNECSEKLEAKNPKLRLYFWLLDSLKNLHIRESNVATLRIRHVSEGSKGRHVRVSKLINVGRTRNLPRAGIEKKPAVKKRRGAPKRCIVRRVPVCKD